jgi:uncharacterized protein
MNRLAKEKSPYLRQHAHNPVDWYPWGQEAFSKAKEEGKPIFLSVGYSTCHWCHVMERESFESSDVADLMNKWFVNVKVDREERPDVDRVYMTFVQATTGGGGWPMSVFLTPELEPFFGGTYFPPDDRYGRPGFPKLLEMLHQAWVERREDVSRSGANVIAQLRRMTSDAPKPELLGPEILSLGARAFASMYDEQLGGFGKAPKFPRPVTFNFLFRHFARSGEPGAAEMTLNTLVQMARGGMYDHLGGGFHRYSVDRAWHVPHFEKMLYDQAQLVKSHLEAWQLTEGDFFSTVARETCDYVLRDLTDPATGTFYSAEDADSEGKEGAFYVWKKDEIDALLGADAEVFCKHYAVTAEGNADDPHGELTGFNVLHRVGDPTGDDEVLARCRKKLFDVRAKRPRPHRDEKVLAAWNGMMIGALARAGHVLAEPRYLEAARRAVAFVRDRLIVDGTLMRRYCDGEIAIPGYLEDYASMIEGLLDLHEVGHDAADLRLAGSLAEKMIELFHDPEGGGFFSTSGKDPSVLLRMKEDYDGAEPAGNSVAATALFRLAEYLDRPEWRRIAEGTLRAFSHRLKEGPHALPQMLCAFGWSLEPPPEIVLAGDPAAFDRELARLFVPDKVVRALGPEPPELAHLRDMRPQDGKPTAYVCRDRACELPTPDPAKLRELLKVRDLPESSD